MNRRLALLLASAISAAACADGRLPRRSAHHPGHPAAPEGYGAVGLAKIPEDARRDPLVSSGSQAEATVYVCPMHPEVVAGTPGACPKCGMKLIPMPPTPKPNPPTAP